MLALHRCWNRDAGAYPLVHSNLRVKKGCVTILTAIASTGCSRRAALECRAREAGCNEQRRPTASGAGGSAGTTHLAGLYAAAGAWGPLCSVTIPITPRCIGHERLCILRRD